MSIEKWKPLIEIVGVLAIVISLLLVVEELQQTREAISSASLQTRAQIQMLEADSLYNSDYMPRIYLKATSNEELTDEENARYGAWLRAFLRMQELNYLEVQIGTIDDWLLDEIRRGIPLVLGNPVAVENWNRSKLSYAPPYRAFVDSLLVNATGNSQ